MNEKRYILMVIEDRYNNEEYLYPTAKVVEKIGKTGIVEITCNGDVDYIARYQLGRLQSGMAARWGNVMSSIDVARVEAEKYVI